MTGRISYVITLLLVVPALVVLLPFVWLLSGALAAISRPVAHVRRKRAWPKPFTADEERFRQRAGVQPYINLQHEWATGLKRE
jgi:hypothetical protein